MPSSAAPDSPAPEYVVPQRQVTLMVNGMARCLYPASSCGIRNGRRRRPIELRTIGIDLGNTVFHLVGMNLRGEVVVRKKLSHRQLLQFTAILHVDLIGKEACGGAHSSAGHCASRGTRYAPSATEQPSARGGKFAAWMGVVTRIHCNLNQPKTNSRHGTEIAVRSVQDIGQARSSTRRTPISRPRLFFSITSLPQQN
jgi:hypothetical protein